MALRPLRRIRSFVRRQGRLTKGQEHALENYWPVMGVEFSEDMLDFPALFGREAPVTLEIGFGMGASLYVFFRCLAAAAGVFWHRWWCSFPQVPAIT